MPSDPQVSYKFASQFAEIGTAFHVSVARSPDDGVLNEKMMGKVRALRISLEMKTEGRGDTDTRNVASAEIPVDRFGAARGDIVLAVPIDLPISYDGRLLRVVYEVTIRTDTQLGLDPKVEIPVVVVPQNGIGRYGQPHPLRSFS